MIEGSLIKNKERDSRHKFNWHMLRTLKVKTPDPNLKLEETGRIRASYGMCRRGPGARAAQAPELPWFLSIPRLVGQLFNSVNCQGSFRSVSLNEPDLLSPSCT